MAKTPPKLTKVVSEANLARLGGARLAELLTEAATADPALKRRLRLELAAELGAAELSLELDKRLQALAGSKARISWRKRPELLREVRGLERLIAERLAELEPRLALDRLVAWFDLYSLLAARAKDPKGELAMVFDEATGDLARLASAVGPKAAAPILLEALSTRSTPWASFVGRGAGEMSKALAQTLLAELPRTHPAAKGKIALVMRKLADRAGDLDAWLASLSEEERRKPGIGAEIAGRLAGAGRAAEARAALAAARGASPDEAWHEAEIAVLEAEGRAEEATEARWRRFERTLSAAVLREIIAGLDDFEDVVAIDRAVAFAAGYFDPMKGLAFLMEWGALREAAGLVVERREALRGNPDDVPVWAARLAGRFNLAALLLLRARAETLYRLGGGASDEAAGVLLEAEALAAALDDPTAAPTHAAFVQSLTRPAAEAGLRRWLR